MFDFEKYNDIPKPSKDNPKPTVKGLEYLYNNLKERGWRSSDSKKSYFIPDLVIALFIVLQFSNFSFDTISKIAQQKNDMHVNSVYNKVLQNQNIAYLMTYKSIQNQTTKTI